jgi:hypothetical protein
VEINGSAIEIGPDLLHRGSTLLVSALLEGGKPKVSAPSAILKNVKIIHGRGDRSSFAILGLSVSTAVMIAMSVLLYQEQQSSRATYSSFIRMENFPLTTSAWNDFQAALNAEPALILSSIMAVLSLFLLGTYCRKWYKYRNGQ